ncbi:FtsB family cell division protein [Marinilabilia rubra]|uniref:Septum formation initiator n=1 Tax=Marinilabilia rubra TaxID=2162893 RepID=A0A2U2BA79_9BACT|nr:septum formation initiator family protein [Marinilabilia rubra]PWD99943.1 septum formation initiator [Marinilabilia rubra]
MSLKSIARLILPLLKNRYVVTFLAFIIWVGFFDQNNLVDRHELSNRIEELERQKVHYRKEISNNKKRMEELQSDPENLEKFAREQYLMKKPEEDIFVVIEE